MTSTIFNSIYDAYTTVRTAIPLIYNSQNLARFFSKDCIPLLDKVVEGVKFAFDELAKGYQSLRDSKFTETGSGVAMVGVALTLTCLVACGLSKKPLSKALLLLAAVATAFFTAYTFEKSSTNLFTPLI